MWGRIKNILMLRANMCSLLMSVTGIFAVNVFQVPSMILQLSIRIIILIHAVTKKVVCVRNGIESGSFHWLFTGTKWIFFV